MIEEWKDVPGREGKYQVSSLGRVRGLDRQVIRKDGIIRPVKGRILIGSYDKHGYPTVFLGRGKCYRVHRLVGTAFIPNPKNKIDINHRDSDRKNNKVLNLEWATRSENLRHAITVGSRRHPNKTGLPGVRWHATMRKYEARVSFERITHILGYFNSAEAGHAAYSNAVAKYLANKES